MQQERGLKRYGALAMGFHWLMALLVAAMFALAWVMFTTPEGDPRVIRPIVLHKSIGVVVLALALLRLIWRQINPPPPLPPEMPAVLRVAAQVTHRALYLLLIAVPILGWLMSTARGITTAPFGLFKLPNVIEKNESLAEQLSTAHIVLALTLLALIVLHVAAGVFHHVVRRDEILARMTPFLRPRKV
jgi:cytochrome b561